MAIPLRNPASITRDGKTRQLKNLGWLTRNWQEVQSFTFRKHPTRGAWDGVLIADLKDGGHFQSEFASYTVARGHFLDRPIFRGLELTTVNRNGTVVTEEIGSAAYRAVKGEALRQNPRRRNPDVLQRAVPIGKYVTYRGEQWQMAGWGSYRTDAKATFPGARDERIREDADYAILQRGDDVVIASINARDGRAIKKEKVAAAKSAPQTAYVLSITRKDHLDPNGDDAGDWAELTIKYKGSDKSIRTLVIHARLRELRSHLAQGYTLAQFVERSMVSRYSKGPMLYRYGLKPSFRDYKANPKRKAASCKRRRNPGFGDYLQAGKKALVKAASESASRLAAETTAIAKKAASEALRAEREREKLSPVGALEVLAEQIGYKVVKANPRKRRAVRRR